MPAICRLSQRSELARVLAMNSELLVDSEALNMVGSDSDDVQSSFGLIEDQIIEEEEEDDDEEDSVEDLDVEYVSLINPNAEDAMISRKISRSMASSIIGGSSIHEEGSTVSKKLSVVKKKVYTSSDNLHIRTTLRNFSLRGNDDGQKIFSFSLPFGDSLLNFLPSVRLPRLKFFNNDNAIRFITTQNYNKHELKRKLKRNNSLDTFEEAYLYKDFKGADNSRLRAVRKALTPNIAIDAINYLSEKKKIAEETISTDTVFDHLEGDIVILGGYRGSILRDRATNRRVWIPIKVGLNLRKVDLTVGPRDEDEEAMEQMVYADGMLKNVGPIDISKRLIKKLGSCPKVRVHDFGYDWRLSPDINSRKLQRFLESLPSNQYPRNGATVLAHSMGGIIAHHVMNRDPTLIRGLVYVGAPSECLNILGPIRYGDAVLLSKTVLTAEANFLMRSSFVFLPRHGKVFYDKNTGRFIDLNLFDPDVWVKYNLSPLVSLSRRAGGGNSTEFTESSANDRRRRTLKKADKDPIEYTMSWDESYEYLERTLGRTKRFIDELQYVPEWKDKYPPLAVVYGNKVPSVRGVFVDGEQDIAEGNYTDFFYGPGDGVIHQKWLMPENIAGFKPVAKIPSDCGHVSLLTDIDSIAKALAAIQAAHKL